MIANWCPLKHNLQPQHKNEISRAGANLQPQHSRVKAGSEGDIPIA